MADQDLHTMCQTGLVGGFGNGGGIIFAIMFASSSFRNLLRDPS